METRIFCTCLICCARIQGVCDSVASYNLSKAHWCTVARCNFTSTYFHCMRASKRYNFCTNSMKHLRRFPKINLSIILKLRLDYRPKRSDPSNTSYVRIILECYGIMCASLCMYGRVRAFVFVCVIWKRHLNDPTLFQMGCSKTVGFAETWLILNSVRSLRRIHCSQWMRTVHSYRNYAFYELNFNMTKCALSQKNSRYNYYYFFHEKIILLK